GSTGPERWPGRPAGIGHDDAGGAGRGGCWAYRDRARRFDEPAAVRLGPGGGARRLRRSGQHGRCHGNRTAPGRAAAGDSIDDRLPAAGGTGGSGGTGGGIGAARGATRGSATRGSATRGSATRASATRASATRGTARLER